MNLLERLSLARSRKATCPEMHRLANETANAAPDMYSAKFDMASGYSNTVKDKIKIMLIIYDVRLTMQGLPLFLRRSRLAATANTGPTVLTITAMQRQGPKIMIALIG